MKKIKTIITRWRYKTGKKLSFTSCKTKKEAIIYFAFPFGLLFDIKNIVQVAVMEVEL